MTAQDIWNLFDATYLNAPQARIRYVDHQLFEAPSQGKAHVQGVRLQLEIGGQTLTVEGQGNGPIDAAVHALQHLGMVVQVRSFEERSTKASTTAADAQACAFLELTAQGTSLERFGVGLDSNIVTASLQALISGVNRLGVQAVAHREQAQLA